MIHDHEGEIAMSWNHSKDTANFLADCMIFWRGRMFLKHPIGGYKCQCGKTMNIWSDGSPSLCDNCSACICTSFNDHPPLHDNPDYGPTFKTIEWAAKIAMKNYRQKNTNRVYNYVMARWLGWEEKSSPAC